MKTTKSQFSQFKRSFLHWQKEFGCLDFEIAFTLDDLDGCVAQIKIDTKGKVAVVEMTNHIDGMDIGHFNPVTTGKHEALHLLLRKISHLVSAMGVTGREIEDAEESAVRVLEKLL